MFMYRQSESSRIAIFKHNFTICDIFIPLINLKGLWDLMNLS